ncbi:MAG TPA: hypothetical protein VHP14_10475 [Anaerolineales bacterium]|nr:hypothetical protein [Anaerolineales bacterium]
MAPRKILFAACLLVSTLCLAAGYGIVGKWVGTVIAVITSLTWLLARKYPTSGLPFICLLASVCMAVVGQLAGSPPLLMICGAGVALAVWDLLLLDVALEGNSSDEQTRRYENKHLQSLILALGSGLFVAFLGRLFTLRIPFVMLVLFVALAAFSLDRVWVQIKKQRSHR